MFHVPFYNLDSNWETCEDFLDECNVQNPQYYSSESLSSNYSFQELEKILLNPNGYYRIFSTEDYLEDIKKLKEAAITNPAWYEYHGKVRNEFWNIQLLMRDEFNSNFVVSTIDAYCPEGITRDDNVGWYCLIQIP